MASTFTQNLLLENPTTADAATNNVWGITENTGRTLLDSAVAGIVTLSVAGSTNVVLTSVQGAPDQSRNAHFVFTGVLTGNVVVLWPSGRDRVFTALNGTTGAFTLSCGVNNGGVPAGTTVTVPVNASANLLSDGTNVTTRVTSFLSPVITGGTIDGTTVGATTAAAGSFTTLAVSGAVTGVLPAGGVIPFAGSSAPAGWLLCNGQAVSRTTFATLFAVVSTIYGAGDGSTTFNMPDLRGRTTFGLDNMGGGGGAGRVTAGVSGIAGTTLGAGGGDQHAQQDNGSVGVSISDPTHFHLPSNFSSFVTTGGTGVVLGSGPSTSASAPQTTNAVTGITATAAFTSANLGASQNMPPTMMMTYIIKT